MDCKFGYAACENIFRVTSTTTDSHLELPCRAPRDGGGREVEFVPFGAAIAAQVAHYLTAHVFPPALENGARHAVETHVHGRSAGTRVDGHLATTRDEGRANATRFPLRLSSPWRQAALVLICSGDPRHSARRWSLIHAVEEERCRRGWKMREAASGAKDVFSRAAVPARPRRVKRAPGSRPRRHRAIATDGALR